MNTSKALPEILAAIAGGTLHIPYKPSEFPNSRNNAHEYPGMAYGNLMYLSAHLEVPGTLHKLPEPDTTWKDEIHL